MVESGNTDIVAAKPTPGGQDLVAEQNQANINQNTDDNIAGTGQTLAEAKGNQNQAEGGKQLAANDNVASGNEIQQQQVTPNNENEINPVAGTRFFEKHLNGNR